MQQGCLIPVTGIKARSVGGFVKMPRNNDTLTSHDKPIKLVSTVKFCSDKMWCISSKTHIHARTNSTHTQCSSACSQSDQKAYSVLVSLTAYSAAYKHNTMFYPFQYTDNCFPWAYSTNPNDMNTLAFNLIACENLP